MSVFFDPSGTFIPIPVQFFRLDKYVSVRLALDTGATQTLIGKDIVEALGYDVEAAPVMRQITTASGVETTPVVNIERVKALEQERLDLPVICYNLPSGIPFDGLIGLDFFRGQRLAIDFREGLIALD